ncbi:MAG TPA: tail sheath stabilizer and completion protein, partial [Methylomirabilota bacterium]|nr:tail sheath stabilizer and completion protein [Methylomirabilota bacterium]
MVFQGTNFYFSLLRKYVVVFGNFFSDIMITRTLPGGQQAADIRVPLQYAQKDKMLVRLNADPDANRPFSALLPVISFELAGMEYNATSHLNTVGRNVQRNPNDKNKFKVQYNPVPYDIHFNVYIYVKNEEDGHKILEQILPFFTPDWTVAMELIPDMPNEIRDIPVVLKSVALNDLYDGEFKVRRVLYWQLGFTIHAFFYGPERNKPIIKFTTLNEIIAGAGTSNTPGNADLDRSTNYTLNNIDTTDANNQPIPSSDAFSAIYSQPGEFANGQPTANVLQSIDWHLIDVNDNWQFATEQVAEFKYYSYGLFSNNSYWVANSLSVSNNTTLIEDTSSGHHYISLYNKFPQSLHTNGKQYRFQADIKDMIGNRALVVTITD